MHKASDLLHLSYVLISTNIIRQQWYNLHSQCTDFSEKHWLVDLSIVLHPCDLKCPFSSMDTNILVLVVYFLSYLVSKFSVGFRHYLSFLWIMTSLVLMYIIMGNMTSIRLLYIGASNFSEQATYENWSLLWNLYRKPMTTSISQPFEHLYRKVYPQLCSTLHKVSFGKLIIWMTQSQYLVCTLHDLGNVNSDENSFSSRYNTN